MVAVPDEGQPIDSRGGVTAEPARSSFERDDQYRLALEELEVIYRSVPLGLAVFDLELRFLRINDHLAAINGFPAREHVGKHVREVVPWAADLIQQKLAEVLRSGGPVRFELEGELSTQPGERRVWDEIWYPLRNRDGRIFAVAAMVEEITERRRREERLSREARELADAMPQLVWTALPDGTVDYYNERILSYAGASKASGSWNWSPMLHPDDVAPTMQTWGEAARTGQTYTFTHRVRMVDGSYRWHLSRGVPVRDSQTGKILKWFGTATDIHEQKLAQEHLEETVRHRTARLQETIAELESFSYSISHDMRAPLRAMQTYARFLEEEYRSQLEGDGRVYLTRIIAAADRLDRLIRDVLDYSRIAREDLPVEPVDVNELIDELIGTYPQFRGLDIHATAIPKVCGNRAALTQCLSNLLGNAVKFQREGEPPRVRIEGELAGQCVKIRVIDNGTGVPEPARARVFDMFFQVNARGGGTGIGLSIVRKAAERMGGSVSLEASSERGSTFLLELPRAP
ncbi:MAG TPA: PAS domain-containing protein [Acidobacteriota bacterium]|nr:PAS domain-containing protein [Acidobacteriota bacterium]